MAASGSLCLAFWTWQVGRVSTSHAACVMYGSFRGMRWWIACLLHYTALQMVVLRLLPLCIPEPLCWTPAPPSAAFVHEDRYLWTCWD